MKKGILIFSIGLLISSVIMGTAGLVLWWTLPSAEEIRGCLTTTMFEVRLCPGDKNYVPLSKISKHLKRALIVAEDGSFYQHDGFDWQAIQNSFEKNLAEGRYVRGGSTITQQLAKNMFLTRNKTLWRKLREALITRELEKNLKKDEILERYLNVVQFGKNIFGVKKASQFYFKKSPSQLTLNESVFLVFLLPSPEKYSFSFFRKELTNFARKRMKTLLTTLFKSGKVAEDSYQEAINQLAFFPGRVPEPIEMTELVATTEGATSGEGGATPEQQGEGTQASLSEDGVGGGEEKATKETLVPRDRESSTRLIPTMEELEQEIDENSEE